MRLKTILTVITALALIFAVTAYAGVPNAVGTKKPITKPVSTEREGTEVTAGTIMGLVEHTPSLSTTVDLVKSVKLEETLEGPGTFTWFVTSDDAYRQSPSGGVPKPEGMSAQGALGTENQLKGAIVRSKPVLNEAVLKSMVGQTVKTWAGTTLTISLDSTGRLMINNAHIIKTELKGTNGVVHVLDAIIEPMPR